MPAPHIPTRPPEPAIGPATSGRTRWAVTLPLAGEGYENETATGTRVIFKSYQRMRTITIMTAAAGALAAALVFAPRANAERICRQVCDQAGFCQSICVDDDHVFLDNDDKDFYLRHGRPDAFLGR
jgi:hypothetical protein